MARKMKTPARAAKGPAAHDSDHSGGSTAPHPSTAGIPAATAPAAYGGLTLAQARARAYRAVDQIDFADGFHRRDIGWRELERSDP